MQAVVVKGLRPALCIDEQTSLRSLAQFGICFHLSSSFPSINCFLRKEKLVLLTPGPRILDQILNETSG